MGRKLLSRRRVKVAIIFLALAAVLFMIGSNYYVVRSTESRVFKDPEALPVNDIGLVLGSSRTALDGPVNPHFKARVEAAAYLFHIGKVKHLLLSGDITQKPMTSLPICGRHCWLSEFRTRI